MLQSDKLINRNFCQFFLLTVESAEQPSTLSKVIKIDEARIQSHLDKVVRSTVEQTLNDLLDAEADQLCNAKRYEHTDARRCGQIPSSEREQLTACLSPLPPPPQPDKSSSRERG